jgi:hypothetical protein
MLEACEHRASAVALDDGGVGLDHALSSLKRETRPVVIEGSNFVA